MDLRIKKISTANKGSGQSGNVENASNGTENKELWPVHDIFLHNMASSDATDEAISWRNMSCILNIFCENLQPTQI